MTDNLYLSRAWKYVEADPIMAISESRYEDSGHKIIVASSEKEAERKFMIYLEGNTRFKKWDGPEVKVLTAGQDVPLEKRIEILQEIFTIIR